MSFTKQKLFVFIFPLLLSLPFINRAYFVDDSYFVEIGSWLKDHPLEPYHFRTDDAGLQNRGWEEDGFIRMVNPLVHHYYLAFLLKLAGEREWFLRLGCVFLVCFSSLFLFDLARRWTNTPLLATLLILTTPVHWLTAHSLLIDSTLGFFAFSSLYFFIRGGERDSMGAMVTSGILMGLCILTKYPGVILLPLTAAWWVLYRKKMTRLWLGLVPWAIALLFLGAYSWWTASLYGQPHILAASSRMVRVFGWAKPFVFLIFLSGVTLIPLVAWSMAGPKRLWTGVFSVVFIIFLFTSPGGGFQWGQGVMLGIWSITSLLFFWQMWVDRSQLIYPRDHFLILWVLGFVGMMMVVMGWVAARYFVLVVPAVVFLCTRFLEIHWKGTSERILKVTFLVMLCFTSLLAYADYRQAQPAKLIGSYLKNKGYPGGEGRYYLGDSFTMSYLKNYGWIPGFPGTQFKIGDHILSKNVTMPPIWNWKKDIAVQEIDRFEFPSRLPLKVMDYHGSAGFYASVWGALPFSFSAGPWERFRFSKL